HFYPIVSTLVIINIALFLITDVIPLPSIEILQQCTIGLTATLGDQIYTCGMGFNPAVTLGEYWRLVTPIFLHGGLTHVLFNSFALVLFGPALEQMLGKFKFIVAYLVAGFAGNLGTYLLGLKNQFYSILVSSVALFGFLVIFLFII